MFKRKLSGLVMPVVLAAGLGLAVMAGPNVTTYEYGPMKPAAAVSQAQPAPYAPPVLYQRDPFYTSYGPYLFCTLSGSNWCQDTHGVYSQNTIDQVNAGSAYFLMTSDGSYGTEAVYQLSNGHRNCIKENNSDQVVVANGPCDPNDPQERWAYYGSVSDAQFFNVGSGSDWMGVTNLCGGCKVWGTGYTSLSHWTLN